MGLVIWPMEFEEGDLEMQQELAPACGEIPSVAWCYLYFCAANLRQLEGYIEQRDVSSISKIAHVLRGNAGRVGLSDLSALGRQLEGCCEGPDWEAIVLTYRAITNTVERLCGGRRLEIAVKADSRGCRGAVEVKRAD